MGTEVPCGSASYFTLLDIIPAGSVRLPIPVKHLSLPTGTREDLLDPVAS